MPRIISANLNGIRSATQKGFFDWLAGQHADVVCVQELKAQHDDLTERMRAPDGLQGWFHPAEKKGYSGVGLYARREPDRLDIGLGIADIDAEGRYLRADFGALTVVSLYLPSGSSSDDRQQVKFDFLARFLPYLRELAASGRDVVVCGDWNIAHQPIDLKNWKSNQKNSGFLPQERDWMEARIGEEGWVDAYRVRYPNEGEGCYTWWSNRGQAWAKNVGWRLDYQLTTPGIGSRVVEATVYKAVRFSDHAPLVVDYDYSL